MTDPTATEAAAEGMRGPLDRLHPDIRQAVLEDARSACEALGIDPDAPVSLLHWHATQQERERCATIADSAGQANGHWIADEIRRSDPV